MKIRRFRHSRGSMGGRVAYVEFRDDKCFFIKDNGAVGNPDDFNSFTLAEAEAFKADGTWVEMGTLLHMPAIGDWPEDFGHENGNYWCICANCHANFTGHKRRVVCKECVRAGLVLEVDMAALARRWNNGAEIQASLTPALPVTAEAIFDVRVNGKSIGPRTMDSAELFQHFRNFRYASMGVNGLGSAYPDAVKFIDNEVAIRVAEILKGLA